MRSMILAFILFSVLNATAAPRCEEAFGAVRPAVPDLEDLALQSPEIEAKFLIPSLKAYENLKSLIGREIILETRDGRNVVYVVEANKEHIYEDTNFDTKDLALYGRRGMLRQRTRYDRKPGEDAYRFNKVVFQAKDGPTENKGLQDAVYARNEIRGEEYKKLKKFLKKKEDLLSEDSEDLAVQFARDYSRSDRKFKPVLQITDHRFFMKLRLKDAAEKALPWFYVSLDNVTYEGLRGRKTKASRLELEAEIGDELAKDSPDAVREKLAVMDRLSAFLAQTFGLKASPESKYESGVRLTVLPPEP